MKIMLKNKLELLEERMKPFIPITLDEESYQEYKSLAINGFILVKKYVVYLYEKVINKEACYFALTVSTYVKILSCQQDITTKERKYIVELFDGKEFITLTLDSDILTAMGAKKLLQQGCVFDENNTKYLLQYLSVTACSAPVQYVHSGLGWIDERGLMFLSATAIGKKSIESNYVGNLHLKANGDRKIWFDMVSAEVIGNPMMEFSLMLAFAVPVLSYLNKYFDLGCFVFNFGNSSSKGKTSTAMLIASVFGSPSFDNGLLTTFNSTENALVTFVAGASGHPVIIDEVATASVKNLRTLLYQFCSGKERNRNDKEGKNKKSLTFNSIIITTAEFPIIDETASNGIRARVFEVSSDLTINAQNADTIKRTVLTNYGHAGKDFVKFIFGNKLDLIVEDYENSYNLLIEAHHKNNLYFSELTMRILSKLAVILVTARYVNQCFRLNFDTKNIINTILRMEQSVSKEPEVWEKALECVRQYLSLNKNKFIIGCNDYTASVEGKVLVGGKDKKVIILKSVMENILKNNGFENKKLIFNRWIEKKIIYDREKDRPTKRIYLSPNLPKQPCFFLRIAEE